MVLRVGVAGRPSAGLQSSTAAPNAQMRILAQEKRGLVGLPASQLLQQKLNKMVRQGGAEPSLQNFWRTPGRPPRPRAQSVLWGDSESGLNAMAVLAPVQSQTIAEQKRITP